MAVKMTKKALSTEGFRADARFLRFGAQKSHFGAQKAHFGAEKAFLAPKSPECDKVRGHLIFGQETSS